MNILGLAGQAGAGKDHAYSYITKIFSGVVERVAFADGLKFDIEEALGLTPYDIPAIRSKPYSDEVRRLLQWWGTDLRREHYGDDYWVRKGIANAEEASQWAGLVVVTDVRFANEAQIIRDHGGIVAEVIASNAVRAVRTGGLVVPEHESELIDFSVDAVIDNGVDGRNPILPPLVLDYIAQIS